MYEAGKFVLEGNVVGVRVVGDAVDTDGLIGVLVVANGYTALNLGALVAGIPVVQEPQQYLAGLPFAIGLGIILGVRELAMRLMAKKYKVNMSLPFLLPSSQLGSFGAFSRISSPLPHRLSLFDIAIAPALAS